jgi:phage shock protein A
MLTLQWRYATGYVRGFVSGLREYQTAPESSNVILERDDHPDVLLAQAQTEMRENQAKNRERAVQAITAKNNLQNEVDKTQKIVANLQAKAEMALKSGQRDLARQLLVEKQQYDGTLTSMQASLASANETVEAVKVAIRREEERIRAKTAEAMALKTQWKQSQIEISINKALEGMTTDGTDQAFERASAKISNARSESAARGELQRESLNGRIAGLEDVQANSAADDELAKMEQRMGLAAAPATQATAPVTPAAASDIDRQLQELEAKVGGGGSASS